MSEAVKKLLPAVMALTPAERDELFGQFDEPCEFDPDYEAEIQRRIAACKADPNRGEPSDVFLDRMHEKH